MKKIYIVLTHTGTVLSRVTKILTKNNEIQEFDIDIISKLDDQGKEYRNNIEELLVFVDRTSNVNEEKYENSLKVLDYFKDNKFMTKIEYDEQSGLAKIIRIKIKEK